MRIRVLGCSGGSAPGRQPSCYLLERGVVVDAGALATSLSIDEQQEIRHVFLTHAHWDHVRDLPLHTINRTPDQPPLVVHGLPETISDIRTHLMNDRVWFAAFELPSPQAPYIASEEICAGDTVECSGYRITAVEMQHTVPAVGFLFDDGTSSVMLSADTLGGGFAARIPTGGSPLGAIFLEASFPNRMREFAEMTGHLTPEMLGEETEHLGDDVQILVTHMKPGFEHELIAELAGLGRPNIRAVKDGDVIEA